MLHLRFLDFLVEYEVNIHIHFTSKALLYPVIECDDDTYTIRFLIFDIVIW